MKIALVLCLVLLSPIGICDAYEYIPNTKLLVRDGYEVKWG